MSTMTKTTQVEEKKDLENTIAFVNGAICIDGEGLVIATSRGEILKDDVLEEFSKTEIFSISEISEIEKFKKACKGLAKIGRTVQAATWLLKGGEVEGKFYVPKYQAEVLA